MSNKPTVIFFDIETSPVEYLKFQKDKNPYFSSEGIIHDSYMISAAWKKQGDKKVNHVTSPNLWDDYNAVKKLRDELSKADILVGHNIDKFDIKFLNARIILHGLPPLPLIPTIDTLKEVKRVATFTSHKLDYLTKLFFYEGKLEVGFGLWKKIIVGPTQAIKRKALNDMVTYNLRDVVKTEELYNRLRPYMKNHPHIGVMQGKDRRISCNKCGSTNVKRNGIRVTAAGLKKQEIQCQNCGSYHRIPLVNV
jgi:DNA polymerase elongation subunit (family B)